MRPVGRLARVAGRLLDALVGGLLTVIVVITLTQVAARYVFESSLVWSEELTRLLHLWMVALAAVGAVHMQVRFFVDRLPPKLAAGVEIFSALLSIAVLGLMTWGAWSMTRLVAYDMYIGIELSKKYLFLALVVAAPLWAVVIAARTRTAWRRLRGDS